MFTTKTALSLHGTFKSTTIFNNLRSPNLPQIYKLLLSKEHGESLQRKKGSSFLPEQNIADKLTKLPCRLSLVEFGILLDNSCIRTSGTTKLSKRQFSDSASSVEASPGRTVGDLLKVKGENFYSTKSTDLVYDAIKKMVDNNVGSLVVISEANETASGKPLGIVTERDYLRKIVLLGRSSKTTLVKDIMTSANNLVSVHPSASLHECMEIMTQRRIRHIPVVDDNGSVKGMISIGDLVKAIVEEHRQEAKKLNEYIQGTY